MRKKQLQQQYNKKNKKYLSIVFTKWSKRIQKYNSKFKRPINRFPRPPCWLVLARYWSRPPVQNQNVQTPPFGERQIMLPVNFFFRYTNNGSSCFHYCRSFFKLVSSAVDNAVGGRNNGLSLSYIHMFIQVHTSLCNCKVIVSPCTIII